jgi:hypothetical protein
MYIYIYVWYLNTDVHIMDKCNSVHVWIRIQSSVKQISYE